MRDKELVFEELGKARHTLGPRSGERWMELALRLVVLLVAAALAAVYRALTH